jgi:ATP phosphoribosyltransferase regulatory subunit
MTETASKPLLPEGLRDMLPPDAAFESDAIDGLKRSFAANGYAHVKPPLAEFEETLLSGVGTAMGERIFRMLDPVSNRTLGIRADITTQVARIAATRLAKNPRPLRLMYAGQVLRVRGSHLEPERQFSQAGLELIGAPEGAADAEIIVIVAEALADIGVAEVSVDLALPTLVPSILSATKVPEGALDNLRTALDHKDVAEIKALGGDAGDILTSLVSASGPYIEAVERISKLQLPDQAKAEWKGLVSVADAVRVAAPDLSLTVDAVENRGFEYHCGVTFSVFAQGAQRELGRGGRYQLVHNEGSEPAVGATLLVDALLGAMPRKVAGKRLYAPYLTPRSEVTTLQGKGWSVVTGLTATGDDTKEARRLECTHVLIGAKPKEL